MWCRQIEDICDRHTLTIVARNLCQYVKLLFAKFEQQRDYLVNSCNVSMINAL